LLSRVSASRFGTFAVCQDEQPLAPVRSADFRRRKEVRRNCVAQSFKVSGDLLEPQREVSRHILEKTQCGFGLTNALRHEGPQMSLIALSTTLSGEAERLAWVPAVDEVDLIAARFAES